MAEVAGGKGAGPGRDLLAARALRRAAPLRQRPMRRRDLPERLPEREDEVDGGWEHARGRRGKAPGRS